MITLFITALFAGQSYNDPANFCANPRNGLEISRCTEMLLTAETERMTRYLSAAKARLDGRTSSSGEDLASALMQSQTRWEDYANAACGLVRDATDFGEQDCRSELTQQRTHDLWAYFLIGSDGPPLLEEPEPLMVEAVEEQ